jgi:hypothetical protein
MGGVVTQKIESLGGGQYLVPSDSEPGHFHKVNVNEPSCKCKGFQYRGGCKHLRRVAEEFDVRHDDEGPQIVVPHMFTTRYANQQLANAAVCPIKTSRGEPKFPLRYTIEGESMLIAPPWRLMKLQEDEFVMEYRAHLERCGVFNLAGGRWRCCATRTC